MLMLFHRASVWGVSYHIRRKLRGWLSDFGDFFDTAFTQFIEPDPILLFDHTPYLLSHLDVLDIRNFQFKYAVLLPGPVTLKNPEYFSPYLVLSNVIRHNDSHYYHLINVSG